MEKREHNGRFIYSFTPEETKSLLEYGLGNFIKNIDKKNLEQSEDSNNTDLRKN